MTMFPPRPLKCFKQLKSNITHYIVISKKPILGLQYYNTVENSLGKWQALGRLAV